MIKFLTGDFETVDYDDKKHVLLHDNHDNEAYPVHWHNDIELIMPLKNYYVTNVCGVDYRIEEQEMLIIPAGELHSMPAVPGHRLIFQCGSMNLSDVPVLEAVMRALKAPMLITADVNRELHIIAKKTMMDIYKLYNSKSELAVVKIYLKMLDLFVALREFQIEKSKILMDCDDETITEYSEKFGTVFKYIDNNYMYDISLEQLANVAGYSKYHFSRIFKQYNSMSYLQYINARRVKAAEVLLLDHSIPITEVAMRSGFKSLTTFNRIFKDIKHCTPSDFKRLCELT